MKKFIEENWFKIALVTIIGVVATFFIIKFLIPKDKVEEVKTVDVTTNKIEEQKPISANEITELKKEIESLKSKTIKQSQNQQIAEGKISELKDELKSTEILPSENYEEQSNVVLDSIAKVICYLDDDMMGTGSGSIWAYGDNYYLITNKHVLKEADGENESCVITVARDWNAVANDSEKAYQDDNLFIYSLNKNYTYWENEEFDFAITQIVEYEQPLTFLNDVAMVTNEAECNENLVVGSKIKIIGFPYTSSFSLPTITEGIISSWENISNIPYYITSAKIEHGNSGGIAVTDNYYCMIGIPTAVVVGDSESLGRILMLTEKDLKELFENM